MRAIEHQPDYYELTNGDHETSWAVARLPDGWLIVDQDSRQIPTASPLGREILAAIATART